MVIRVCIVDDHPIVREALSATISKTEDMVVATEVGDGFEAVEAVTQGSVDVVLLDLQMPGKSGLEALEDILALESPPRVIMLSSFDRQADIKEAINLGASGYLLKAAQSDAILDAIRAVYSGINVFGDTIPEKLMSESESGPKVRVSVPLLTPRELEVLAVLSEGLSNPEIAKRLWISTGTAKTHVANIITKLEAKSRTEAVIRAMRSGLLDL